MARNEIPRSYSSIVQLLEDAADGAQTHGVAIGLKQNDETALRAVLAALEGTPAGPGNVPPAVVGLKGLRNAAETNKVAKTALLRSAKSKGRELAMVCVGVLKPRLGSEWNSAWAALGFTGGSLGISANPLAQLLQIREYYVANPTHEVPNISPTISATALACEAAAQAISTASSVSNQSNTDLATARQNLELGLKAARGRLSGLREELVQLIGPDSDLWYAFGYEKPSDPETPEVPKDVTAVAGALGSSMAFVDWADARRADTYRARVMNTVTNAQVAQQIVLDSSFTFSGLPSGVPLAVTVSAINEAGESQETAPVLITLL